MYLRIVFVVIIGLIANDWTRVAANNLYPNIIEVMDNKTSTSDLTKKLFCVFEYVSKNQTKLPAIRNIFYELINLVDNDGRVICHNDSHQNVTDLVMEGKLVLIRHSSLCDINRQIDYFRNKSINGLILTIECNITVRDLKISETTVSDNPFTISLMAKTESEVMLSLGSNQLKIFDVKTNYYYDLWSEALMWCLATFTTMAGAVWSGRVRYRLFLAKRISLTKKADKGVARTPSNPFIEPYIEVTYLELIGLVVFGSVILLLLFFFHKYIIFLFIILFAIYSVQTVFSCVNLIAKNVLSDSISKPSLTVCEVKIEYYKIAIDGFAVCTAIVWFFTRHESYSWFLHDIIGITVCMFVIKLIRLSSLKMCLFLLWLFFFYDIFMVFITPFIFKGRSVMVEAAMGGPSSICYQVLERIPVLFWIPRNLFQSKDQIMIVCKRESLSVLGFGDVIVPGFFVGFCYTFDMFFDNKYRIYFVTSSVGYGTGLIAAFFAVALSEAAQPALLYLVPFTTLPVILIGLIRRELSTLWTGPEQHFFSQTSGSQNSLEDNKTVAETQTQTKGTEKQ